MASEAKIAIDVMINGVANAKTQLSGLSAAMDALGRRAQTAGRAQGGFTSSLAGMGFVLPSVGQKLNEVGNALESFSRRLNATGERLVRLGGRMTAFVGLPFAAAIGGSIKAAANFEFELVKMETQAGLSAEAVDLLGENILRLGPAVGQMPGDLAAAQFLIVSGGLRDVSLAASALEAAAKGSATGLGEVQTIAEAVTTVMINYAHAGVTAADAMDFIIAVTQRGKFEVDEFSGSVGESLGLLAEMGISLDEVGAAIATLTQTGKTPSEAFTDFNRLIISLAKPTPQALRALEAAQLDLNELRDLITEQGGVTEALFIMREAFDAAGISAGEFFTRKQGWDAFVRLTGNARDLFLENLGVIQNMQGLLDQSFERVSQTATFQFQQLKSSINVVAITIGAVLLPAVNAIVDKLMPLLALLAEFGNQHPRIVLVAVAFGLLAASLGPVLIVFGIFLSSIANIVGVLGTLVSALAGLFTVGGAVIGLFVGLTAAIGGLFLVSLPKILEKTGRTFDDIKDEAYAWGRNIIISLANGIAGAVIEVVNALITIGKVIRDWLKPGSPPRLLPDIDDWGAGAMREYLKGFTQADFGIFKELASTVASFFKSLPADTFGGEEGVFSAILGSRGAIARGIEEVRKFGSVTAATLAQISGAFTETSGDIATYVMMLFDVEKATLAVERAQAKINAITEKYTRILDPINDRLQQISNRRQQVTDQLRSAELERIINDPRAPALAKELAQLELEEIRLKDRLRAQENLRDQELATANTELENAEAALNILREQAELQKSLIDVQIENNNLMRDFEAAVEAAANKLKSLAEGAAGALGASKEFGTGLLSGLGGDDFDLEGEGPFADLTESLDLFSDEMIAKVNAIGTELQGLADEVLAFFDPLFGPNGLLAELADVWSDIFLNLDQFRTRLEEQFPVLSTFIDYIDSLNLGLGGAVGGFFLVAASKTLAGGAFKFLSKRAGALLVTLAGSSFFTAGTVATGGLLAALAALAIVIGLAVEKHGSLGAAWDEALGNARLLGEGIGMWIEDKINSASSSWDDFLENLQTGMDTATENVSTWWESIDWHQLALDVVAILLPGFSGIWGFLTDELPSWGTAFEDWFLVQDWYKIGYDAMSKWIDGAKAIWLFVQAILPIWWGNIKAWFARQDWFEIGRTAIFLMMPGLATVADFITGSGDFEGVGLFDWVRKISEWFATQSWYDIAKKAIFLMVPGLASIIDWILGEGEFVGVGLVDFFTDVDKWWAIQNWGKLAGYVIEGIVARFEAGRDAIIAAVEALAQGAVDAWNRKWGNKSPSRVATEDAGKVMAGYIRGVEMGIPRLAAAFQSGAVVARTAYASRASGYNVNNSRSFNVGNMNINNGMDAALMEHRVRRAMDAAL